MSYDVSIGSYSGNYTSNTSKLYYDHIPDTGKGGGLCELDGVTGRQAVEILARAFERIRLTMHDHWRNYAVGEPTFCALYDSPSGWGSTVGSLIFLAQILAACAEHPRHRVHVGC